MTGSLTFFTHPMSRGRTVRWMLEEIGEPYETEILTYGQTMKSPEYLAVNPMGKVPAIRHGDVLVTECGAILTYLADAFPAAGLAPPIDDRRRGSYLRWLFFGAGCIDPAAANKSLGFTPPDGAEGMLGYGDVALVTDTLDGVLSKEQPYLTGDTFTAADLYIGSQLSWLTGFGVIEKRPSFDAFISRVLDRPAVKRAKDIDDNLIAERPELIPERMRQS